MDLPTTSDRTSDCPGVSRLLGQVGDKWTVQVLVALRDQARRFNDLKRRVDGISQQMLTRTLRALERDGTVERTVRPTMPPQVDYALTPLGLSLSETVRQLANWAVEHRAAIRENRLKYDAIRSTAGQLAPKTELDERLVQGNKR
jgi:DNA-binding HxlR family transcriptional regulator